MRIEILENYKGKLSDGVLKILDEGLLTGSLAYGVKIYNKRYTCSSFQKEKLMYETDVDIALTVDAYNDLLLSFKMSDTKYRKSRYQNGIYLDVDECLPMNIFCLSTDDMIKWEIVTNFLKDLYKIDRFKPSIEGKSRRVRMFKVIWGIL